MKAVASRPVSDDLVFHKDPQESDEVGQLMVNLKLAAAMDLLQNNDSGRNIRLTNQLETTISQITGKKFSFRVVDHPKVELRVDWGTKKQMRISQLPDGLRSIIGWLVSCCARLSMYLPDDPNPLDHPFVLVLDEPEGNLHPAWQRKVLPAARKLFKNAQIIAATHSPWVVSSVNEGFIHVLRFNSDEQVTVDPPKPCEKGDSYIDVVEDVLGVKEWFDPETEALLAEFRDLVSKGGPAGEIERLAAEIGGRGEYLAALVGREMAGFRRKSQQPKGA
ncbi:MAG: AAA family ATPase [Verrucomicrobia bacterium]|nr:AAA family ATPase [Verrucomicrobiota bacterium]